VDDRDKDVIALTHVCRTWREVFTSRPSLWTRLDLDIMNEVEVRIYLERSKSSPVGLLLEEGDLTSPSDLFSQIVPQVIGRLGYLVIRVTPGNIRSIDFHLSRPAPLLEDLSICGAWSHQHQCPVLASTLFDGNLSSLRKLYLEFVRTELPWRNMVNLMTFTLRHTPRGEISASQLLDFFESAPHLREVELHSTTPTPGAQNRRLVSLTHLKKMKISYSGPPPVLLDHLLIPVGAKLILEGELRDSLIGDLLPRSLDNLRNLSNYTTIELCTSTYYPLMAFSGPNGQVIVTPRTPEVNTTGLVLESLTQFDTSKTERLRIEDRNTLSRDLVDRILLPMKDLRFLVLCERNNSNTFIRALNPSTSSSTAIVCPQLEELFLAPHVNGEALDTMDVIGMAEARASRGKKLKTLGIAVGQYEFDPDDVLELGKHVGYVEHGPHVGAAREVC